jgi:hypothetical protein
LVACMALDGHCMGRRVHISFDIAFCLAWRELTPIVSTLMTYFSENFLSRDTSRRRDATDDRPVEL